MTKGFITKEIHAYLDYPVALMLITVPYLLDLGDSHPGALWFGVITGLVAFLLTLLTDHHLGVLRVLPYWFHLAADFCVGLAFIIVPLVLGFKGLDLAFYIVNGAVVLSVVGLHKPAPIKEL